MSNPTCITIDTVDEDMMSLAFSKTETNIVRGNLRILFTPEKTTGLAADVDRYKIDLMKIREISWTGCEEIMLILR